MLREYPPQDEGKLVAGAALLFGGEDRNEPFHRARAVACMEGGEHEMARLRRAESRAGRGEVAHLADEDDVRVLAKRVDKRV